MLFHGKLTLPSLPSLCRQHGSNLIGMTDLNVPEQLYQYMVGGHRRAQAGANRERHKSPSYQIKVDKQNLIFISVRTCFVFFSPCVTAYSCQSLQKFCK